MKLKIKYKKIHYLIKLIKIRIKKKVITPKVKLNKRENFIHCSKWIIQEGSFFFLE